MRPQILPSPKHIETKRRGNVLIFLAVSAFDDVIRSPETTGKEEPWPWNNDLEGQMHCCGPSKLLLSHCRLLSVAVCIPVLLGELLRCHSARIPSLFHALGLASATSLLNKHVLNPDPRLLMVISTSRPRLKFLCAYRWERTVVIQGVFTRRVRVCS